MKVFVVYAHPEPQSFNGVMLERGIAALRQAGHEVRVSDLYAMGFNPVPGRHDFETTLSENAFSYLHEQLHANERNSFASDIASEMENLAWCDALVLQFPLWWYSMPAILKGWIDRVFAYGFAYGGGRRFGTGVFRGKRAMLAVTAGGSEEAFTAEGPLGDIATVLHPIQHGILHFVGMDVLPPFVAFSAEVAEGSGREQALLTYEGRLAALGSTPAAEPADPVLASGNSLRDELFQLVRGIPPGRCCSYGSLGQALSRPVSGKIVGQWMATCPPDIPWWRVVTKDGGIALFNRDPELGHQQRRLLEGEGVPFAGERAAIERCLWEP